MNKRSEDIALFDMDGTLCDYDSALSYEMNRLRSPNESEFVPPMRDDMPDYLKNRADLIRSREEWWAGLPKFQLGCS